MKTPVHDEVREMVARTLVLGQRLAPDDAERQHDVAARDPGRWLESQHVGRLVPAPVSGVQSSDRAIAVQHDRADPARFPRRTPDDPLDARHEAVPARLGDGNDDVAPSCRIGS